LRIFPVSVRWVLTAAAVNGRTCGAAEHGEFWLGRRFDALGDDAQVQGLAQPDDGFEVCEDSSPTPARQHAANSTHCDAPAASPEDPAG
jgi:hypothetical protein